MLHTKMREYPPQCVTINPRFCWMFVTFLAIGSFNKLSLLSEGAHADPPVVNIHIKKIFLHTDMPADCCFYYLNATQLDTNCFNVLS